MSIAMQNHLAALGTGCHTDMKTEEILTSSAKMLEEYQKKHADDEAAKVQIFENARNRICEQYQFFKETQNEVSLCQVADNALTETSAVLQRISEISVQAEDETSPAFDRNEAQKEVDSLTQELTKIAEGATFGQAGYLLKDAKVNGIRVDATAEGLGLAEPKLTVSDHAGAKDTAERVAKALDLVNDYRAEYGVRKNRTKNVVMEDLIASENKRAAESEEDDVDSAKETMVQSMENILKRVAHSLLTQANQRTQAVKSLLR